MSFAERKLNLVNIEKQFNQSEEAFLDKIRKMMDERKRTYLRDLQEAVQSKNYEDLAVLFPDLKGEIAKEYSSNMKSMFEYGKKVTSDEMQVDVPETSKDVRGLYRAQGLQMEAKLQNEMGITAQSEALYQIAR